MTRVMSLRLKEAQLARLQRLARRLGRTPSEAALLLIEEGLRSQEFGCIQFRDTPSGRQAFILGTRVPVWQVVRLNRIYAGDAARAASHLGWPAWKVGAALAYHAAHPEEIDRAIEDGDLSRDDLGRLLPNLEIQGGDRP